MFSQEDRSIKETGSVALDVTVNRFAVLSGIKQWNEANCEVIKIIITNTREALP